MDADPENSKTLEGMLAEEAKGSDKKGTQALLWLLRGLEFTLIGMKNSLEDENKELSVSFTEGYQSTLKPFHNFVVKGIFAVRIMLRECPLILIAYIHAPYFRLHSLAIKGGDESMPVP